MKIKRKILIVAVLLTVFTTAISAVVPETVLGELSYWYAESSRNDIYRMKVYPKVAWQVMSGGTFSQSNIDSYTEYAVEEWSGNGMTMSETSNFGEANIYVYAGTYNAMKVIDPEIKNGDAGHTYRVHPYGEGKWQYGWYSYKDGYVCNTSKIVILWDDESGNTLYTNQVIYKNIILHEIGHTLGWDGHSTNTGDVMHTEANSSKLTLTNRDVNHVKQIKAY